MNEGGIRERGSGPMSGPALVPAVALASAIAQVVPGAARHLELVRGVAARGEPWRILGSHLAHFSGAHFLLDIVVFLALGLVCEQLAPRRTWWALALAALAIPAAVLAFAPQLSTYRGLSGLDSALFALLATHHVRSKGSRSKIGLAAGALFAGKVVFEVCTGASLFLDAGSAGFVPVPIAHAAGALCGAVAGFAPHLDRAPRIASPEGSRPASC